MDDYIEHSEMSILAGWETDEVVADDMLAASSFISDGPVISNGSSEVAASEGLLDSLSGEDESAQVI